MGSVKDAAALERYRRVLLDFWHITDQIQWNKGALDRLSQHLPNIGKKLIHELMHEHVVRGGPIDQVEEKREEYVWWRFHYDLRLPISGQRIYIETVFDDHPDPEDCTIHVVNIHPA
jgi:hypothetical protein